MLSRTTIAELRGELTRLRRRVELLEQLLEEHSQAEGTDDRASGNGTSAEVLPTNGSFAAGVRHALRSIGRVASTKQVTARMIQHGYATHRSGKPLKNRVAVELFRQAKQEIHGVRKVSKGKYKITEED